MDKQTFLRVCLHPERDVRNMFETSRGRGNKSLATFCIAKNKACLDCTSSIYPSGSVRTARKAFPFSFCLPHEKGFLPVVCHPFT